MKTLSTLLITLVLFSSCKSNNKTTENTKNTTEIIKKEKAHLGQTKFTNAIQVYGEPQVSNKIKVTTENLTAEQMTIVNEYFPNKEYNFKKVFFLEAQWHRPTNSELTVWYLFIENEWKPIEVLLHV